MRRPHRSRLAGSLLAAALSALAACGGGSGSDAAKSTATSTASTVKASRGGGFCDKIAATYNEALGFASAATKTPDELRQQLETTRKEIQETIDQAPGEAKADLQVIRNAITKFSDALAKVGYDTARLGSEAVAAASVFSTPEFEQAAASSQNFVKEHCGIDVQPTTTSR